MAVSLAALALVAPGLPASADRRGWPDPSDGKRGPLDIKKVQVAHTSRSSKINVIFERPISPKSFGRDDFLAVEVSGGKRPKTDYIMFYGARGGHFVSFIYDPQTKRYDWGFKHHHPSPRVVTIVNPEVGLSFNAPGYRFRVSTFSKKGGWDAVPKRNWLFHDWARPEIRIFEVPEWTIPSGPKAFVKVKWGVYDKGASGLRHRTLWMRESDSGTWKRIRSHSSAGTSTDIINVEPGTNPTFKITARDGAGNTSRPYELSTRVPLDDTSSEHQATFVGAWSQEQRESAYLSSLHISESPVDTFTFTADANVYCVVYRTGEEWGIGRFDMGRNSSFLVDQSVTYGLPYGYFCLTSRLRETRTVTFRVERGVLNVDGFYVESF